MMVQQLHLGLAPATAPPEADLNALPDVLRAPPWRQPRPAPLVPAGLSLTLTDTSCEVVWGPGERARLLRPVMPPDPWHLNRLMEALKSGRGSLWNLRHLSDTDALQVWNTTPPAGWERLLQEDLLEVLARFDLAALPGLLACARHDLPPTIEALAHIKGAQIAPLMARALVGRSARIPARRWLLRYPGPAASGLIPAATGECAPRHVLAALRLLVNHGHRKRIQNTAAGWGPRVRTWIARWLAEDPRQDVPSRRPKMPAFWDPASLRRPTLHDGSPLPPVAVQHIGEMLCFSRLSPAYSGLTTIKQLCEPESLSAFLWELFCAWEAAGHPPQHDWPLWALGHLGSDDSARQLASRVRAWPGQSGASRAINALQVFVMIGTPIALMYLHHIAETTRYPGLRQSSWDALAEAAMLQRRAPAPFLDQPQPRLGLDEQGRCSLDFGTRRFEVSFGPDLNPRVRDQRGRSLRTLPRPGRRDILWRAERAHQIWRALRQDVRILTTTWSRRMERSMCLRQRWPQDTFHQLITHPLLSHHAAGLIWAAYAPDDSRLFCFRIAEDWSLSSLDDAPLQLPPDARIGLPHRLHITDAEAEGWLALLANNEITQPFCQLLRPVFRPTPQEQSSTQITRFVNPSMPPGRIMALLSRGWQWGEGTEAGFTTCRRPLPGIPYCAELPLSPGIAHTAPGPQKPGPVIIQRMGSLHPDDRLSPGQLDAIVFSELLADLSGLTL